MNLSSIIVIIEQHQTSEIYGQCLSKIKVSITKQGMVSCMVNSVNIGRYCRQGS